MEVGDQPGTILVRSQGVAAALDDGVDDGVGDPFVTAAFIPIVWHIIQ